MTENPKGGVLTQKEMIFNQRSLRYQNSKSNSLVLVWFLPIVENGASGADWDLTDSHFLCPQMTLALGVFHCIPACYNPALQLSWAGWGQLT